MILSGILPKITEKTAEEIPDDNIKIIMPGTICNMDINCNFRYASSKRDIQRLMENWLQVHEANLAEE